MEMPISSVSSRDGGDHRGIAFDMDGVIIDGMPFHLRAWTEAFSPYGIEVTATEIYMLEGARSEYVVDVICSTKAPKLTPREKKQILLSKRKKYAEIFHVVPLQGATALIETLSAYGYKLALVTGAPGESAQKTIQELGISRCFSAIVSYETVSEGKPSPAPYLAAQSALAISPENCLVVENSPVGIQSAKVAGLPCVAVATYLDSLCLTQADRIFASIKDCAAWLVEDHRRTGGLGRWKA